ncbi:hypothetical protein KR51_00012360 [Rubidibacter lacunae KORDI 51-2]|uniref:Response regulator n=1 Tax=Rubidibacter lacunae KORDI 51-2 TaxID=582515 RepID=U5DMT0_9CHRO|nr:hypothetical protein [Rubidibacter lacunae]ERN42142.1 hypothetical protein KR51_00012360 [Rubidibacter lacunae KORDI 51-2]
MEKTILVIQKSDFQAQIWHAALVSQQFSVIRLPSQVDLNAWLSSTPPAKRPDLLAIEMTVAALANPYAFCRWCRDRYPNTKVLLTSNDRDAIADVERRWAVSQGAIDLLPGFRRETILTSLLCAMERVTTALDCGPLDQQALAPILMYATQSVPQPATQPLTAGSVDSSSSPPAWSEKGNGNGQGRGNSRLLQLPSPPKLLQDPVEDLSPKVRAKSQSSNSDKPVEVPVEPSVPVRRFRGRAY